MTVTEIAKLAGVSIGTVDRVLHNRGRVSPKTQEKIRKIIKQSGYQPDPIARHLKKHMQYHIGVLIPELDSGYGYWQMLYDGITNTAATELAAFSFTIVPFFFKRPLHTSLITQFKEMIDSNCCAYIIAPVMQEETKVLLDTVAEIKPYCFVDSPLPDCMPVSTIAQDPLKAGFLAGRLTQMIAGKPGTYIVLESYDEAYNQNERARGFTNWFNKSSVSGCKVLRVVAKNADVQGIKKEIDDLLAAIPDIAAICTVSVEVQFVAEHLKELGKTGITVTGFELVQKNYEALVDRSIDCIISQQPEEQGRTALRLLFRKLVYEEQPEKEISMPLEIFFILFFL